METTKPLNIFYEEPDPDRWFKYDRYPRRIIRNLIRGKQKPGGVMTIAINLMKGLDKIGVPYRFNDYNYIDKHPEEVACIIGKPQVLFNRKWNNPILFGAGIYSHPLDCPDLFVHYPNVKRLLVPGEWMRKMFEPFYGDKVLAWPVGTDTDYWKPTATNKTYDFLIYDKLNRDRDNLLVKVLEPILKIITNNNLTYRTIRYGTYTPVQLKAILNTSKAAIFLSESESQGLAYQQTLSVNVPILAWDSAGYWQDPCYYPQKVKYQPVSSVPYWDDHCGLKFKDIDEFEARLTIFLANINLFKPRDYILENLSLEKCAEQYLKIFHQVENEQ